MSKTKTKTRSESRTQPGTAASPPRDVGSSRPPSPTRTLALGTRDEALGPRAPQKARPSTPASWRTRARDLARTLDKALASSREDPATIAAVERASLAFALTATDPGTIGRVAHLVSRAHEALHEPPVTPSAGALRACAHVLYNGLPRRVRERTTFVKIEEIVLRLAREAESFPAVVRATADLLGWSTEALDHAGRAIRLALATDAEPLG